VSFILKLVLLYATILKELLKPLQN